MYIFLNSFIFGNHIPEYKFYNLVLDKDKEYFFGIDVSHYQGNIDWKNIEYEQDSLSFVFVRATMGTNRRDSLFLKNFKQAKSKDFVTGAYHYYDPNQRPEGQAKNFLQIISLENGDLKPVLDIEKKGKYSEKEMISHLKIWLNIVERELGVQPIIYSSFFFWEKYLKKDFGHYNHWLAAYSVKARLYPVTLNADAVQYADTLRVQGVSGPVDGNKIKRISFNKMIINKIKN